MPPKPPVLMAIGILSGLARIGGAAGKRQDRREVWIARDLSGESGGLRRAAEDQDAEGHGRE